MSESELTLFTQIIKLSLITQAAAHGERTGTECKGLTRETSMDKESSTGFIERCRERFSIEEDCVARAPLNREEVILWRPLKDDRDWDLFSINTLANGEHFVRTIH